MALVLGQPSMSGILPSIVQDELALPDIDLACILEVLLDSLELSQKEVAAVARNIFAQIYLVFSLCLYLNWETLLTVIHSWFTFCLDYCNALHMDSLSWRLRIYNCSIIKSYGAPWYAHVTSLLWELSWFLTGFWVQFQWLIITWVWVTYRMANHQLFLPIPQVLTKQTCSRSLLWNYDIKWDPEGVPSLFQLLHYRTALSSNLGGLLQDEKSNIFSF